MSETKNIPPRRIEDDWISVVVAVGVPLMATMADPQVTLGVTFSLLMALTVYYRIRSPFRPLWMIALAGAAVVLRVPCLEAQALPASSNSTENSLARFFSKLAISSISASPKPSI